MGRGMTASQAGLYGSDVEPDVRYERCCSNVFRRGRVVRDCFLGLVVLLVIAAVIGAMFLLVFFVLKDLTTMNKTPPGNETLLLSNASSGGLDGPDIGASTGRGGRREDEYNINDLDDGDTWTIVTSTDLPMWEKPEVELSGQPETTPEPEVEPTVHEPEPQEPEDEGTKDEEKQAMVPELELFPEPSTTSEPEPEPTTTASAAESEVTTPVGDYASSTKQTEDRAPTQEEVDEAMKQFESLFGSLGIFEDSTTTEQSKDAEETAPAQTPESTPTAEAEVTTSGLDEVSGPADIESTSDIRISTEAPTTATENAVTETVSTQKVASVDSAVNETESATTESEETFISNDGLNILGLFTTPRPTDAPSSTQTTDATSEATTQSAPTANDLILEFERFENSAPTSSDQDKTTSITEIPSNFETGSTITSSVGTDAPRNEGGFRVITAPSDLSTTVAPTSIPREGETFDIVVSGGLDGERQDVAEEGGLVISADLPDWMVTTVAPDTENAAVTEQSEEQRKTTTLSSLLSGDALAALSRDDLTPLMSSNDSMPESDRSGSARALDSQPPQQDVNTVQSSQDETAPTTAVPAPPADNNSSQSAAPTAPSVDGSAETEPTAVIITDGATGADDPSIIDGATGENVTTGEDATITVDDAAVAAEEKSDGSDVAAETTPDGAAATASEPTDAPVTGDEVEATTVAEADTAGGADAGTGAEVGTDAKEGASAAVGTGAEEGASAESVTTVEPEGSAQSAVTTAVPDATEVEVATDSEASSEVHADSANKPESETTTEEAGKAEPASSTEPSLSTEPAASSENTTSTEAPAETAGSESSTESATSAPAESSADSSSSADASPAELCPAGELRCLDGQCIKLEHVCDGVAQCSDGADEINCRE